MSDVWHHYLRLFRLPAVFTAMSNVFAGYIISGGPVLSAALPRGMLASAFMLMAGMALNDIADREVDARERPDRPIPSGAIPPGQAIGISIALLLLAFMSAGFMGFYVFATMAFLTLSILVYNFKLKATVWSPLSMGLCRALNLALGLQIGFSVIGESHYLNIPVLWALFGLFAYVVLITFIARDETKGNSADRAGLFLFGLGVWAFLAGLMLLYFVSGFNAHAGTVLLAGIAVVLFSPLKNLWREPGPQNTGRCVGLMIALMPLVDSFAILVSGASLVAASWGLVFVFLTRWTGRKFYTT